MIADTDASIVCTNAERDFIEARGGSQVAVAGAGVDPNRFTRRNGAAIRARFGIGGPTVGFVGRQDVTKGVPTLIEAMHTVWREIPDAFLLLAGQSAHRHEKVTEKLASLTAARRRQVVLVDDFADEELPSIMDACDLLALPDVRQARHWRRHRVDPLHHRRRRRRIDDDPIRSTGSRNEGSRAAR
jgi:glycosyltransferase involved in cell wall biosynthesis